MQGCLKKTAGQVLCYGPKITTAEQLIDELKTRFGTEDQAERFRIELKARRRKKGEGLQTLHNDVLRLVSLAYPGDTSSAVTLIARDAFLDALNNKTLSRRVRTEKVKTLSQALSAAINLESLDPELGEQDKPVVYTGDGQRRDKAYVRTAEAVPLHNPNVDAEVREMRAELERWRAWGVQGGPPLAAGRGRGVMQASGSIPPTGQYYGGGVRWNRHRYHHRLRHSRRVGQPSPRCT